MFVAALQALSRQWPRKSCETWIASHITRTSTLRPFSGGGRRVPDLVQKAIGHADDRQAHRVQSRVPTVAVIGAGSVGAAIANAIIHEKFGAQLLMVDVNTDKCVGEVLDLSDAAALAGCSVNAADWTEAGQADVIIVTAGAKSKPNEPRTSLIDRNVGILQSIVDNLQPIGNNSVLVLVANPVDVLTTIAQSLSGLPKSRVMGSGTTLDTLRLRASTAQLLGVYSQSVHLTVVGEHGDSQVPVWSSGFVGGAPLSNFPQLTRQAREELANDCRAKANEIIRRKGATFFGIAACASMITRSIVLDMRVVLPVSSWSPKFDMYISQPCIVGRNGVKRVLDICMDADEMAALDKSAANIRRLLDVWKR